MADRPSHWPGCDDGPGCTMDARADSDADICRARGWGPGTVIEGDEGYGPERVRITALGDRLVLAVVAASPWPGLRRELTWTLRHRCWREVPIA